MPEQSLFNDFVAKCDFIIPILQFAIFTGLLLQISSCVRFLCKDLLDNFFQYLPSVSVSEKVSRISDDILCISVLSEGCFVPFSVSKHLENN